MTKDQEIASLQHKNSTLEAALEKAETTITESKSAKDDAETHRRVNEDLNRKIALLESELDTAEKSLRETTDKYVWIYRDNSVTENETNWLERCTMNSDFDK